MSGEILAGVLLGPFVIAFIHDPSDIRELGIVADLGVFLLVFLAGLEMNMDEISKAIRGGGLLVGVSGFAVPFALGYGLGTAVGFRPEVTMILALGLAVTALPVSVRILLDLGLTHHPVGQMVVSAAIINDLIALTLLGIVVNIQATNATTPEGMLFVGTVTVLKALLLISIVVTFVQALKISTGVTPGAQRRVRQVLSRLRGREALFAFSLLFVLAFASVSQILGLHFVVGAFFGGLLLSVRVLGEYNFKQVERTTSAIAFGFLAPIFFGYIGLRFVPDAITANPVFTAVVIGIAVLSKLAGGILGGKLAGFPMPRAFALGLGLNARGMIEIVVASLALSLGIIDRSLFSILVLMTVVTTMMTPPLLKWAVRRSDAHDERAGAGGRAAEARKRRPASGPGPLASAAPAAPPIVIVGGGQVAIEVARVVGPCTVLERDPEQARFLASVLSTVRVVVGDAHKGEDLTKAGVCPGAWVLALTDSAEANEFVVRHSRAAGASRIVARAEGVAEVARLRALGADAVVNAPVETASTVILELYPADASLVDVLIARGSPVIGKAIGELDLPLGTVLRSVTRRGKVHVPTPDLVLEPRDSVILGGPPSGLDRARELLLGPAASGHAINVLAFVPQGADSIGAIAGEVAPLTVASGGVLVVAIPFEPPPGDHQAALEAQVARSGAAVTVLPGHSLSLSGIPRALSAANVPPAGIGSGVSGRQAEGPPQAQWILAIPWAAIGPGDGRIAARKVPSLPTTLGIPVYIATGGAPPTSVLAVIDGVDGAEVAGVLACDVARASRAHLAILLVCFEGEPEPRDQAAFIESYARNTGLGAIEVVELADPGRSAIERAVRGSAQLVVAPALGRALQGRDLAELVASGGASVILA